MTLTSALALALATSVAAAPASPAPAKETLGKWTQRALSGQDIWATLRTSQGDIVVKLFPKDAPRTVANFVGLATGEKEWTHPRTGEKSRQPLYDGVVFHRVIPDFMVQGGDPLGTGTGGPGYRFEDEFQAGRRFDKVGLLAMANSGPDTNGSQFFITTSRPDWLNNRHTIFGEVIKGYDVVEKMSKVPRDARDRPLTAITLEKVALSDKAPAGKDGQAQGKDPKK